MPIQLESGNLQLTDDEIRLYGPAAQRLAQVPLEQCRLDKPMTQMQFVALYLAHCLITDDTAFLQEVAAIAEAELRQRKVRH